MKGQQRCLGQLLQVMAVSTTDVFMTQVRPSGP